MTTNKNPEVMGKEVPKEVLTRLSEAQIEVKNLEGHYQQAVSKCDALLMTITQMLGFDNPKDWQFQVDLEKQTITGTKL